LPCFADAPGSDRGYSVGEGNEIRSQGRIETPGCGKREKGGKAMFGLEHAYLAEKYIAECIEGRSNFYGFSMVAPKANPATVPTSRASHLVVHFRILQVRLSWLSATVRLPRWMPVGTPLI
jgi:hypothetical protein